jgi:hypothetical protein
MKTKRINNFWMFFRKTWENVENGENYWKGSNVEERGLNIVGIKKFNTFWILSINTWEKCQKRWKLMQTDGKESNNEEKGQSGWKIRKMDNFWIFCQKHMRKCQKGEIIKKRPKWIKNLTVSGFFRSTWKNVKKGGKWWKMVKSWRKRPKWMRNQEKEQFRDFF